MTGWRKCVQLGMPETQQRSKEAVGALQAALKCPDMGAEMAKEVNRVCVKPKPNAQSVCKNMDLL